MPSEFDAGAQDALTSENIDAVSDVLKAFSRNNQAVVLATGKQDFVTDGEQVVLIENGTAALSGITGDRLYGWGADCGVFFAGV